LILAPNEFPSSQSNFFNSLQSLAKGGGEGVEGWRGGGVEGGGVKGWRGGGVEGGGVKVKGWRVEGGGED
jgi:hypothetical protein